MINVLEETCRDLRARLAAAERSVEALRGVEALLQDQIDKRTAALGALRERVRALAEEWERLEREYRGLYERCMAKGDETAVDSGRDARKREKIHRDHAAALRGLLASGSDEGREGT